MCAAGHGGGGTAHGGASSAPSPSAQAGSNGRLVGILEGGAELLKNGSTVDEARSLYSRQAVTRAMGVVRARILREGLCGVKANASACVGAWCRHKGQWGVKVDKVLVENL